MDGEAFKRKNGFTVSDFLKIRRNCADSLRRIADHIEKVTCQTGIARTGGALAVIGSFFALPFTAGATLPLMLTAVAGWDYLLSCPPYNSVCLFWVEGNDTYLYQITCKKAEYGISAKWSTIQGRSQPIDL